MAKRKVSPRAEGGATAVPSVPPSAIHALGALYSLFSEIDNGEHRNHPVFKQAREVFKHGPQYLMEFLDFGPLPFEPSKYGLVDGSWHNDVCPSFSVVVDGVNVETLWMDYEEPKKREMQGKRFLYCTYIPTGEHNEPLETLLETDDQAEAEAFLRARLVKRLGDRFAEELKSAIGGRKYSEVRWLNAQDPDANGSDRVCHSHDFCDANMVMDAAFRALGLANLLDTGEAGMSEETASLWNDAWNHAKREHLILKGAA